jgi:hypothetical protein
LRRLAAGGARKVEGGEVNDLGFVGSRLLQFLFHQDGQSSVHLDGRPGMAGD